MHYKVEVRNREVLVEEIATEQILMRLADIDEANTVADFLESGGGFDGWTPSFLLKDISAYITQPE